VDVGRTLDLRCGKCRAVFGKVFFEERVLWAFLAAQHVPTAIGGEEISGELRGARDRAKHTGAPTDLTAAYLGTSAGLQRLAGLVSVLCPTCGPRRLDPAAVEADWQNRRIHHDVQR
jgi:hypothetical protein